MESEYWDRRYQRNDLVWTARPNRFLVAEVAGLPPGAALDVGSGEGRNAVWLAEQGWRVTAVDFSREGIEKARRLAEARGVEIAWVLADLRSYQPPEGAYDLVVVLYLHLPAVERRAVHASLVRALRPGGVFLVVGRYSSGTYTWPFWHAQRAEINHFRHPIR